MSEDIQGLCTKGPKSSVSPLHAQGSLPKVTGWFSGLGAAAVFTQEAFAVRVTWDQFPLYCSMEAWLSKFSFEAF